VKAISLDPAGDDDLDAFGSDSLEVGSVEGEDSLCAAFACGSQDQGVVAGAADEISVPKVLQEIPSFGSFEPDDNGSIPERALQEVDCVIRAEPVRGRQSCHDSIGFDQAVEREHNLAFALEKLDKSGQSRFMFLMPGEQARDDHTRIDRCDRGAPFTLHVRGSSGVSFRPFRL